MIKIGDTFKADGNEWHIDDIDCDGKTIWLYDKYDLHSIMINVGGTPHKQDHDTWNDEWNESELTADEIKMVAEIIDHL